MISFIIYALVFEEEFIPFSAISICEAVLLGGEKVTPLIILRASEVTNLPTVTPEALTITKDLLVLILNIIVCLRRCSWFNFFLFIRKIVTD